MVSPSLSNRGDFWNWTTASSSPYIGNFFVAQTTASEGIDEKNGCDVPNRIFVGGISFSVSARSRRAGAERRAVRV